MKYSNDCRRYTTANVRSSVHLERLPLSSLFSGLMVYIVGAGTGVEMSNKTA